MAAEVARVLRPGGMLACVIGGGAVGGEAYELFVGLLSAAIGTAPVERRRPLWGPEGAPAAVRGSTVFSRRRDSLRSTGRPSPST